MYECKIRYRDGREETFTCIMWEVENGMVTFGCGSVENPWNSTFNVPLDMIESYTTENRPKAAKRKAGEDV